MSANQLLDFMNNYDEWYLSQNTRLQSTKPSEESCVDLVTLYEVTQMNESDTTEFLESYENFFDMLQIDGLVFLYIIKGEEGKTRYFYGIGVDIHKNLSEEQKQVIIEDGNLVFQVAFAANFPEGVFEKVSETEKISMVAQLNAYATTGIIEGVPGQLLSDCSNLAINKLSKLMATDTYMAVRIARPLSLSEITNCEEKLAQLTENVASFITTTFSRSVSQNCSNTLGLSAANANSYTNSCSKSDTRREKKFVDEEEEEGNSKFQAPILDEGFVVNEEERQKTLAKGCSNQKSNNRNLSNSVLHACSISRTRTRVYINQNAKSWNDYLTTVMQPRIDYGKTRGLYLFTTGIFTDNKASLLKLDCALKNTCRGYSFNKVPLHRVDVPSDDQQLVCIKNLHFPIYRTSTANFNRFSDDEIVNRCGFSQFGTNEYMYGGNYVSTHELSAIFAVPQNFGV